MSVKSEVEAALLNSEGEPRDEVREALDGVATFYVSEDLGWEEAFLGMAREAFRRAKKEE